ncbi:hypothetical protein MUK42_29960 [Musa troglodytarum]|uniref:Uncharacterized protein n=1 Tax=Musa troglodytarum TaxID=320322 RepID=A0A9E7JWP6_9LILI|nr:hypothetical protein MUK42_29960 [Musa troglodytarum]
MVCVSSVLSHLFFIHHPCCKSSRYSVVISTDAEKRKQMPSWLRPNSHLQTYLGHL